MNLGPTLSGFLCRQNWSSCPLAPGLVRCYCHKPHMQHVTEGWLSYLCGQPQSIQYKIVNQKPDKSLDWSNRPSWKGGQLGLLVRLASWLNWAGPSNPYTQIGFFWCSAWSLIPFRPWTLTSVLMIEDVCQTEKQEDCKDGTESSQKEIVYRECLEHTDKGCKTVHKYITKLDTYEECKAVTKQICSNKPRRVCKTIKTQVCGDR